MALYRFVKSFILFCQNKGTYICNIQGNENDIKWRLLCPFNILVKLHLMVFGLSQIGQTASE